MKISNSKTKNNRKKFFLSFSIIAIALVGSLIIYKNYNLYKDKENQEESTKVDADSTTLAYTINGKRQSGAFPTKSSGYGVNSVTCENGVTAEWDSTDWGLVNINANNNSSIKCSIDFATTLCKKATELHQEQCADSSPCSNGGGYYPRGFITYGQSIDYLYTGAALDCDVNGDGIYDSATERFYYISDYYDTKTKTFDPNYATLVYYKNVANDLLYDDFDEELGYYALWNNGPRVLRAELPTTEEWSNVSLKNTTRIILNERNSSEIDFSYEGYAARLLTYQEVNAGCYDGTNSLWSDRGLNTNCQFLFENTSYSYRLNDSEPDGYWLETVAAYDGDSANYVDAVHMKIDYNILGNITADDYEGVRPAIDVPKKAIDVS